MMAPPRRNVFDALELIVDGPLDIAQDLADSLVHHGLLHRHGIHCLRWAALSKWPLRAPAQRWEKNSSPLGFLGCLFS